MRGTISVEKGREDARRDFSKEEGKWRREIVRRANREQCRMNK